DTSQIYEGLVYNLENLHMQLEDIDTVIISHNHLDHSGALYKLIEHLTTQKLLVPPDMIHTDESLYNPRYRTEDQKTAIQRLLDYKNTLIVSEAMQIDKHVYTTGSLKAPAKEQSLVLDIPNKGLVVLVGCSHPTLPVIIDKARQVAKNSRIYGIIGGLHYAPLGEKELTENIRYIKSLNPDFIIPSHCTGYNAIVMMQKVLGEKVHVAPIGGQFGAGNSVTILPELEFDIR
ncbi:MAG: MBL fold metallo-hydrolase, partial [Patescibacteria group bacterium]|nr:MBL fold metallo-hydrolase [Patescibacteria group bacterium]